MRIPALIVASIAAVLTRGAPAQQAVPDAPQPQKKQAAKPPDPPPPPPPAKDDNAFPEDVSKKAAEAAGESKQSGTASDNAFPEAQSQAAAKAAGNEQALPPGVSSSRSGDAAPVNDPVRSRKDNEVGAFYLKTGDYQGALLRYKDATTTDPTNVNAIFGLAETQRMLKKNTEAARNYQLYLDIVPNGPKAKQALKALKEIQAGK
jgi:tetratricopeptide (TPR) repeat protein